MTPATMFDSLVEQARTLISQVGEDQTREQMEKELLDTVQDDRDRTAAVVAATVEGVLREATRT